MKPTSNKSAKTVGASRRSHPRRPGQWVSKTDLVSFLRCPYAFDQIDRGLLAREEAIDAIGLRLIEDGQEFHQEVESLATPLPSEVDFAEIFAGDGSIFGLPVLRNQALKLLGAPDGVQAAGGGVVPIEIKSHRAVARTDLLELAFYWLLLEPYRTRRDIEPQGQLILRRDGLPEPVDVRLEPERFDEVCELIRQVRRVRRSGVRPRVCGCGACSGPLREEVRRLTRDGKDLTLIWGVGPRYATALESLGLSDYEALIAADPAAVVAGLRKQKLYVSTAQVEQWRRHAQSYHQGHAIAFGRPAPVGDAFVALDLEYDPFNPHIWLIGALICDGARRREHVALWADSPREEKRGLERLGDLLATNPSLPVITWAGVMADLPQLQAASERHRLGELLAPLSDRHIDLFMHAARTLRLPMPDFALGEVAAYFGIPKTSTISGGLEAQLLYGRYLQEKNASRRADLKRDLIAYNRDDLEALVGTHHATRALQICSGRAEATAPS